MSTCADVGNVIESKMSVVQTSNVGITSEVSDYLVVHTGHDGMLRFSSCQVRITRTSAFRTCHLLMTEMLMISHALSCILLNRSTLEMRSSLLAGEMNEEGRVLT